ncbi:hypothetical protein CMV_004671 [Castanea mollissima]|uniref:Uncharacterized protein n=1 Tax=Castanea mollissima TaxID=60419 RepID=A0A8J4RYD4_9ROSI|nr:hypothetical protein CMV_004671 [Castanea mollissima]
MCSGWPPSISPVHPSSRRSEFAEKTEVEEMKERREAVAVLWKGIGYLFLKDFFSGIYWYSCIMNGYMNIAMEQTEE